MPAVTVDPRAATGFAQAVDAYERGRPSYPANAIAKLAHELGLTPASTALDLAAGTGKLTRLLLAHAGRIVAVDPSRAMLAVLRKQLPEVDAHTGTAEAIPLAESSVDAVFVGEAFHWFQTDRACREIARVLSAGGGLALLWNRARWSETELPWLPAFDALVKQHRLAAGEFPAEGDRWRSALQETRLFAPLSQAEVDYVHNVDADGFLALVASWSWIANLSEHERTTVLNQVRELVGKQSGLNLRYCTEIYWTHLT
jgi:SAM-dependent methyltransferase